ncbi:MAG: DNA/RNA nuclease SfsA [Candidatus Fimenecus sp.]
MKSAEITTKEKIWTHTGIFVGEDTFRFHCRVLVYGVERLCYMPSNCKLGKIVSLVGREVYLKKYEGNSDKFEFVVQDVRYKNTVVLINLNYLNRVVEKQLHRKIFDFLGDREAIRREVAFGNYKSDFLIDDSDTIIEVKSLLSWESKADYPIKSVDRAVDQLDNILKIINEKYTFYYLLFSLSPYVKEVFINNRDTKYGERLLKCQKAGLKLRAFSIGYKDDEFYVKKEIPITYR